MVFPRYHRTTMVFIVYLRSLFCTGALLARAAKLRRGSLVPRPFKSYAEKGSGETCIPWHFGSARQGLDAANQIVEQCLRHGHV